MEKKIYELDFNETKAVVGGALSVGGTAVVVAHKIPSHSTGGNTPLPPPSLPMAPPAR